MPAVTVKDLTLVLDATPGCYITTLSEGWLGEEKPLIEQTLTKPFYEIVAEVLRESSDRHDEHCGKALFDWACPPGTELRRILLQCAEESARQDSEIRLWIVIGERLARFISELQLLDKFARVSWEGFWAREWADEANRPPRVQSPFLALNPWIHIVRRPPGVSVQRRFTVSGKLNVLIIVSNPPPPDSGKWKHIEYLEREDGSGMFLRVYRPFKQHRGIGWVYPLRNPTKVGIALCIREYKPHIVIYLGHGYADQFGSGLVLAVTEGEKEFEEVAGVRKFPDSESELEQVLAGKAEALSNPEAQDHGLPEEERPRLFIAFACEAAPAAPALLQSGVPAVLAMRRKIPDSNGTEAMVKHCADMLTNESKSIEEALANLRQFLNANEPQFADERLHFSVPVLHLTPPMTMVRQERRVL